MVSVVVIGVVYQLIISVLQGGFYVDPFLIVALVGGVLIKDVTNWHLIGK